MSLAPPLGIFGGGGSSGADSDPPTVVTFRAPAGAPVTNVTVGSVALVVASTVQGQDFMMALVVVVSHDGNDPTVTTPAGWTLVRAALRVNSGMSHSATYGFYKIAAGAAGSVSSDAGTTVTFTFDRNCDTFGSICAWWGVSTGAPLGGTPTVATQTSAITGPFTPASIVSDNNNAVVVLWMIGVWNVSGTITFPNTLRVGSSPSPSNSAQGGITEQSGAYGSSAQNVQPGNASDSVVQLAAMITVNLSHA